MRGYARRGTRRGFISGEERNRRMIHRATPWAELSDRAAIELCGIGALAVTGDNVTGFTG